MTFRRPRRRSYLILAVVAFMAMTAAGAFNYRPSAFPMMFEPLPVVPCHTCWEFLRSPALEGLLTKEQRTLADLFCRPPDNIREIAWERDGVRWRTGWASLLNSASDVPPSCTVFGLPQLCSGLWCKFPASLPFSPW